MVVPAVTDRPSLVDRLGRLPAELLKGQKSEGEIVDALFMATLMRWPSDAEKGFVVKRLEDAVSREEGCRDAVWALVNTVEFRRIHGLGDNPTDALRVINRVPKHWEKK
jgi:hypothetical protein